MGVDQVRVSGTGKNRHLFHYLFQFFPVLARVSAKWNRWNAFLGPNCYTGTGWDSCLFFEQSFFIL